MTQSASRGRGLGDGMTGGIEAVDRSGRIEDDDSVADFEWVALRTDTQRPLPHNATFVRIDSARSESGG